MDKKINILKLIDEVAYITKHWEDGSKERYIKFCTPEWNERGITNHMIMKINENNDPVTLWTNELDGENINLLLRFILEN